MMRQNANGPSATSMIVEWSDFVSSLWSFETSVRWGSRCGDHVWPHVKREPSNQPTVLWSMPSQEDQTFGFSGCSARHRSSMNCYLGHGEIASPANEVTMQSQINLVKNHVGWFMLVGFTLILFDMCILCKCSLLAIPKVTGLFMWKLSLC